MTAPAVPADTRPTLAMMASAHAPASTPAAADASGVPKGSMAVFTHLSPRHTSPLCTGRRRRIRSPCQCVRCCCTRRCLSRIPVVARIGARNTCTNARVAHVVGGIRAPVVAAADGKEVVRPSRVHEFSTHGSSVGVQRTSNEPLHACRRCSRNSCRMCTGRRRCSPLSGHIRPSTHAKQPLAHAAQSPV